MTDTDVPRRYAELADAASALRAESEAFCRSDRSDPAALLEEVTTVRDRWAALRPFWFGPVMERRSQSYIAYPVVADDIAELAEADSPVDAASLRELVGADQRGIGAVELLAVAGADDRACDYLVAAATVVSDETRLLADDWIDFGPSLATDDAAANRALSEIVSETVFSLGLTASENPMRAGQLAGARWAMLGDDNGSAGVSPLLDAAVVERLTTEFDALAALADFDVAMQLERTIATNVVADLGVTVKFSDADGDG